MDPTATLTELRRVIDDLQEHMERGSPDLGCNPPILDVERACELFNALDQWLTRGGALPAAWIVK